MTRPRTPRDEGRPQRIQLRRSKGWRMPPNTVKVDRTTRFGNPFIVGKDGSAAECVYLLILLHAGYLCLTSGSIKRQQAYQAALLAEKEKGFPHLRGKNLACWCRIGAICHAEVQLIVVNRRGRGRFNMDAFMERYGYRVEDGHVSKIEIAHD